MKQNAAVTCGLFAVKAVEQMYHCPNLTAWNQLTSTNVFTLIKYLPEVSLFFLLAQMWGLLL